MRYLWLFWFPLLFLPNLGLSQGTAFGTLELSDFLIGPYLVLMLIAATRGMKLNVGRLTPWLGLFIVWALLSTVTIALRYGYADNYHVEFGLLKIAKMVLYGLAGVLTARALYREDARRAFDWSLLAASVVSSVAIIQTGSGQSGQQYTGTGFSSSNGISVMMAILFCYLGGRLMTGEGTSRWRLVAPVGIVILFVGWSLSDGRGGWLAAAAGVAYFVFRLGPTRQMIMYGIAGAVVVLTLYQSTPEFRRQVDMTIFPTEEYGLQETSTVAGVDQGARLETWTNEAGKLDNAPVFGSGIWHRGGPTGLWTTGSHNFWLQMFLETGFIGGVVVIAIVVKMWRHATELRAHGRRADIPLKAALIAVIVGGLGETYFYGGIVLFTALAVYAPTGGLPVAHAENPVKAIGKGLHPAGPGALAGAAD